jgi:hypothetical protein
MMSALSRQVNFKEVWTTNICQLQIDPYWTMTQFIESIKSDISRAFNSNDFEIVEAGQYTPGIPSEAAPALQITDMILKDKWKEDLSVSFYVRRRNFDYPQLQNLNIRRNINTSSRLVGDCPICLETLQLISRNGCSHSVCSDCHRRCQQVNYNICPLCRQI